MTNKLSKADIKHIKSSSESDKYLAWQYGVGIETIQNIKTDKDIIRNILAISSELNVAITVSIDLSKVELASVCKDYEGNWHIG